MTIQQQSSINDHLISMQGEGGVPVKNYADLIVYESRCPNCNSVGDRRGRSNGFDPEDQTIIIIKSHFRCGSCRQEWRVEKAARRG